MDALYAAVTSLMDVPIEQVTDGPMPDLALRYDALRRIQSIAKYLSDALEVQLIEAMPEDKVEVPMVGVLRRIEKRSRRVAPGGSSRMHRDLAVAVAKSVGTDPYTGEINDARRDGARDAVRLVTDICSISSTSLKVGARDIGLDPDDSSYVATSTTYAIVMEVDDDAD